MSKVTVNYCVVDKGKSAQYRTFTGLATTKWPAVLKRMARIGGATATVQGIGIARLAPVSRMRYFSVAELKGRTINELCSGGELVQLFA